MATAVESNHAVPSTTVVVDPAPVLTPAHIVLDSKERFQEAVQTKDKYVLIYAYTGEVSPQAEE
jgi:hypothetical protein